MRNYATQMDAAKRGIVTPEIETVAKKENRPVEFIMERVAKGTIAIPANINHKSLSAEAVGDGTRVKINVNLGISGDCKDYEMELRKVRMAVDMGAESIMDLSNYGKTNTFRKQLIDMSPAMIGTVPMYDAIGYLEKDLLEITAQDFLKVVEAHAREGVDFMTIHAGINRRAVEAFMREGRRMNIVSRGGSLLFAWMKMTGNENPFFEYYDEVLDILRRYDVTISLGDALRPGCIDDASDAGQISELIELGNLAQRAWAKDVQVMIEGPGHMAMNEIAANMQMEKRLCHGAPFYVLGPLVTDIAPGYDHITSAIGGAIAAQAGANFLCYVTPAEHLRLPDENDVREGIVASKIAAELKTYEDAAKSIDETLERMGLGYLDQMIIHSPQPWNQFRVEKRYSEENKAVWRALEDAQSEGKVRVIGVSNFLRDDLENLLSDCRVKPMVNQILLHISNTDLALLDYCREQGIQVEAYSPIAHGEALKNPAIAEMAKKYGVNAAQLCIRYVIELGAVALPKTANPDHMASNAAVDFTISSEDMETLKHTDRIADYGEFNIFPVFSGKPLA